MLNRIADDQFAIGAESAPFAQALADHLRATGDWVDVVPGIDSVVARFDAATMDGESAKASLVAAMDAFEFESSVAGPIVEIPVHYGGEDGPDLAGLCDRLGISESEFVNEHTSDVFPVEMVGFTPGFAFIGGLPEQLRVPRRTEPRPQVPAGSVAVADSRTGLYAMASPGGWSIVGRTDLTLFDPHAEDPFLLSPGMRVRFVAS